MIWTAALAGFNVGVITVIWAINPALLAVAEYFTFGTRPLLAHLIGGLFLIVCTVMLSLSKPLRIDSLTPVVVEPWLPVLFAVLVAVF